MAASLSAYDTMKKRLRDSLLIAPVCSTIALGVVILTGSHLVLIWAMAALWGGTVAGSIYAAILRRQQRRIEARFVADFAEELEALRTKHRTE